MDQRSLSKSPSFINTEDKKPPRLRHQSSGEQPWWLDPNSDNVPEGVDRNISLGNDDISQDTTISTVLPDDGNCVLPTFWIKYVIMLWKVIKKWL